MTQHLTKANFQPVAVSAPGRIVLAGEHQDYFNLPVISAGINLRIFISGKRTSKSNIQIQLQNMRRTLSIPRSFPIPYRFRRSYLQAGLNILHREGFEVPGFEAKILSKIPQNAGLSSSSALCVAWARFLFELIKPNNENEMDPLVIADWAHKFEVTEFDEPGGKQDHLATALGGVNYIEFPQKQPPFIKPMQIKNELHLVIGHSLIRKKTIRTVLRIRRQVASSLNRLYGAPKLDYLQELNVQDIPTYKKEYQTLKGVLKIRDITQKMRDIISNNDPLEKWGALIQEQHNILRDDLHLSLPRIESMIKNSLDAGAYGAKINGSGEGGCMYALCDQLNIKDVAEAIKKAHGTPYIVSIDNGVRIEP